MKILITGYSGSGKSFFAKKLAKKLNYKYIGIDEIGHSIYQYPEILISMYKLFGDRVNDENGVFNRKKLGQIFFSESDSLEVKEFKKITGKFIKKLVDEQLKENCVVDWILLPQLDIWNEKNIKILIKANNDNVRKEKIIQRDNVSMDYVNLRDKGKIDYKNICFDFIYENEYDENKTDEYILKILKFLEVKKNGNVKY